MKLEDLENYIKDLAEKCGVKTFQMVGTSTFMDRNQTSDDDFLFLTEDFQASLDQLLNHAFTIGGSVPANELEREKILSDFVSLRKGDVNIILTDSRTFYQRFVAANDFVELYHKRHGVFTLKKERIELFQLALYGKSPRQILDEI